MIWVTGSSGSITSPSGMASILFHFGVRLMPFILSLWMPGPSAPFALDADYGHSGWRPFLGSYLHVRISSARYGRVMMSPIIFGRDLTGNEISTFPVPGYEKIPPQFNVCRTILSLVDEMTSADDIWSLEKKRF